MDKIKKDAILICGILAAACLLWLIPYLLNKLRQDTSAYVLVSQDGQDTASFSLSENQTVYIHREGKHFGEEVSPEILFGEEEGYNLLLIENGQVWVTDADCPDQLCVRQGSISRNGESIICLPHRLVIRIQSKEESELDALTH